MAAFAVVVQAITAGCRSCADEMHDEEFAAEHRKQVEHFEYDAPLADVWRELVTLLGEQGWHITALAAEGRTDSDWRPIASGGREHMQVHVRKTLLGKFAVELRVQQEVPAADGGMMMQTLGREEALEWDLIQRADPKGAKHVDDKSESAGQRGRAVGRGCDLGCQACGSCVDACDRCSRKVP